MARDALKAKLARVDALRLLDDDAALHAELRKALSDRSNYVVAKAAAVAGARLVSAAVPDLLAAYERLFIDSDPLVVGKLAIARALKELDHLDPEPFIRGLRHVQFESTWGGSEDRAGGLRATCAHALVACTIDSVTLLRLLTDALVDNDTVVRREAVRAIAQSGGIESMLLLRFKALIGDAELEVSGECFAALLELEPRESSAFIERFLASVDAGIASEALSALAGSRVPEALEIALRTWRDDISSDMRRAMVFSCAASTLAAAGEFLLSVIADTRGDLAVSALAALGASRFRKDLQDRAHRAALGTGSAQIIAAYARAFESAETD
jgi:hypothetical protein